MNSLKSMFVLIKMKHSIISSAKKISNTYHSHIFRNKLKFNYIISKIIEIRKQKAIKNNRNKKTKSSEDFFEN